MKLPEAIIVLLRNQQFSAVWHRDLLIQACSSAPNQSELDLAGILPEREPMEQMRQQLLLVLELIIQHFRIDRLWLAHNNFYGHGSMLMRGLWLQSLIALDLANSGLDGEDLDFVALAKSSPNLERLGLEGNDLRPWHEVSLRGVPNRQRPSFSIVLSNLLGLVRFKNLRYLNLSKTNLEIMGSYLGALISILVSNSVLERIELRGLGLSRKSLAYCIVACGQMRRASMVPLAVVHGSKRNLDFFKDRTVIWNQSQQKSSQEQALSILSLFTKYERLNGEHNHRNAVSDQRTVVNNVIAECDRIVDGMRADVRRLWKYTTHPKKRKDETIDFSQNKRQKQSISIQTPSRSGQTNIDLGMAKLLEPINLFASPLGKQKKQLSQPNQTCIKFAETENIDPQTIHQEQRSALEVVGAYHLMDLPVDMRIKIVEYLGESRCPIILT